ncbi:hypothetical protein ABGB18_31180 [Nonomuraea sp. B12E4]|uniref:hypothetical protein n=1 Tax=Nonomuraea sp. B12E4 TaxID=3153564 RepID=UPI00325D2F2A
MPCSIGPHAERRPWWADPPGNSRRPEHGIDLWRFRDGRISLKDAYRKVRD